MLEKETKSEVENITCFSSYTVYTITTRNCRFGSDMG